jgi:hypothetical protein
MKRISQRLSYPVFQPSSGADEPDVHTHAVLKKLPHAIRNGNRGEEVAAGAAPGEDDACLRAAHDVVLRERFSSTPTAALETSSEEPP